MSLHPRHTSAHTGKPQQTACAPTVVLVPGWRNSGPSHWQRVWFEQLPQAVWVEQDDWLTPNRRAWVDRLADTIAAQARPVILVASDNDPFCPVRLATAYSRAWGSDLVKLVGAGHINVESGHGDWPLGWGLLQALQEESTERHPCEPLYASIE